MRALGIDGWRRSWRWTPRRRRRISEDEQKSHHPETTTTRRRRGYATATTISNETVEEKKREKLQRECNERKRTSERETDEETRSRENERIGVSKRERRILCEGVFGPFTMKTPKTNGPITVPTSPSAEAGGGSRAIFGADWMFISSSVFDRV